MVRSKRSVGVFTATRAEYGLLRPLLAALDRSATLTPRLIVSGTHLSDRHGGTLTEIEADGRTPSACVPVLLADDSGRSVAADMAAVLAGAAEAYRTLELEAVIILGDRTEALAAAAAAVPLALPIVHLEGGHRTAGAVDDAIRHAISKLAALHFTGAEPYRQRLLQMGEAPERVFTVGSTGVDNLEAFGRKTAAEASAITGLDLPEGFVLATFHPETLAATPAGDQVAAFIAGLEGAGDRTLLITLPNADVGSGTVRAALERFAARAPDRVRLVASLGAKGYAAALTACAAVVGNSSSGMIEAPAAGVPTVNVGDRQEGRLRAPSVIDCALSPDAIASALRRALDPDFRRMAKAQPPMFGDGHAGQRIVDILETTDFAGLARKPFIDLPMR
ncbi:UDP-N-acetylglucosamine 2-epimerase [Brevundimonas subvibrioides]|uniref:UDP-N-acetyl-D-glucosamine 2-epimerase, UDP-hydrolysing n=1 Tax=Brevundimonas subvibrioides (strain ATCC 15264 / DSM 4735 / LMG 14903 / NBRC 16000 / CB 81) TaxID=633149 RepID=D9QG28_BRESC|nr:UDP-N-acetylglucosamine 2-epimerase [Brevundimonas subvibrioides]ADL02570.1 UDP-N-acetyl-D-glucosamine 2-epimerase, UDP-hydrolysing [Brevundimonas subvibrioides ATCC 15264]